MIAHVGDGGRGVRAPKKSTRDWRCGQELLEEYLQSHEFLHIDMEMGSGTILPKTSMETTVMVNPPTEVRRIRRHLDVAILDEGRPKRGLALASVQRADPA